MADPNPSPACEQRARRCGSVWCARLFAAECFSDMGSRSARIGDILAPCDRTSRWAEMEPRMVEYLDAVDPKLLSRQNDERSRRARRWRNETRPTSRPDRTGDAAHRNALGRRNTASRRLMPVCASTTRRVRGNTFGRGGGDSIGTRVGSRSRDDSPPVGARERYAIAAADLGHGDAVEGARCSARTAADLPARVGSWTDIDSG